MPGGVRSCMLYPLDTVKHSRRSEKMYVGRNRTVGFPLKQNHGNMRVGKNTVAVVFFINYNAL